MSITVHQPGGLKLGVGYDSTHFHEHHDSSLQFVGIDRKWGEGLRSALRGPVHTWFGHCDVNFRVARRTDSVAHFGRSNEKRCAASNWKYNTIRAQWWVGWHAEGVGRNRMSVLKYLCVGAHGCHLHTHTQTCTFIHIYLYTHTHIYYTQLYTQYLCAC